MVLFHWSGTAGELGTSFLVLFGTTLFSDVREGYLVLHSVGNFPFYTQALVHVYVHYSKPYGLDESELKNESTCIRNEVIYKDANASEKV